MTNSKSKSSVIPYLIIGTFTLFGVMIFSMVYGAFQQDVNLIRPDYYAQEVKYESRIQEIKRTNALGDDFQVNYTNTAKEMEIQLPKSFDANQIKGEFWFLRPSNGSLDFKVPLTLSAENLQVLNLEKLQKGRWKVELTFSYNDQTYFKEHNFNVN